MTNIKTLAAARKIQALKYSEFLAIKKTLKLLTQVSDSVDLTPAWKPTNLPNSVTLRNLINLVPAHIARTTDLEKYKLRLKKQTERQLKSLKYSKRISINYNIQEYSNAYPNSWNAFQTWTFKRIEDARITRERLYTEESWDSLRNTKGKTFTIQDTAYTSIRNFPEYANYPCGNGTLLTETLAYARELQHPTKSLTWRQQTWKLIAASFKCCSEELKDNLMAFHQLSSPLTQIQEDLTELLQQHNSPVYSQELIDIYKDLSTNYNSYTSEDITLTYKESYKKTLNTHLSYLDCERDDLFIFSDLIYPESATTLSPFPQTKYSCQPKFTPAEKDVTKRPIYFAQGTRRVTTRLTEQDQLDAYATQWLMEHDPEFLQIQSGHNAAHVSDIHTKQACYVYKSYQDFVDNFESYDNMIDGRPAPTTEAEWLQWQLETQAISERDTLQTPTLLYGASGEFEELGIYDASSEIFEAYNTFETLNF